MNLRERGSILLISCYELGHQPLGVASPFGFLKHAGFAPDTLDIAADIFEEEKVTRAKFVGISVPMHTALRLGLRVIARIREINPTATICCYGLYAALNADYLLEHGADYCIGGECETPLLELVEALELKNGNGNGQAVAVEGVIQRGVAMLPYLRRLTFALPVRETLPPLDKYAQLEHKGKKRTVGYTEASRGCL